MLDGFTVTGGNANGGTYPDSRSLGGGMYNDRASPMLVNCIWHANFATCAGGGMFNVASSPTLMGCRFTMNSTNEDGGGMLNLNGSSPRITSCLFSGNWSNDHGGGILNADNSNPTLINCVIKENSAGAGNLQHDGGGMFNDQSTPILINCTFSGNSANQGGGMYNRSSSSPTATNCILWGNTASLDSQISNEVNSSPIVAYSDVQGGYPGLGNLNKDPNFIDPDNDDFHLMSQAGRWDPDSQSWVQDAFTSPCIDTGNPGTPLDKEPVGIHNVRVNMGAYGGTAEASKTPPGWGLLPDLTNDGIVNGEDFCWQAGDWLKAAAEQPGDLNRDGRINCIDLELLIYNWLDELLWP